MEQLTIEASTAGTTEYKCVDRRGNAKHVYLVILDMESGTGTVDFEFTPDDCIDETSPIWIQHNVLCDVTESCASMISVPFQGFRMNVKKHSGGTIKLRLVQGGYHGY